MACPAGATTRAADKQQLAALRERIEAVQQQLDAAREERDELREQLRDVERAMGAATFALNRTRSAVRMSLAAQARLKAQEQAHQAQWQRHRRALAAYMRAAYVTRSSAAGTAPLRLALQQQQAAQIGRVWAYHGYIARARAARIGALRQAAEDLAALRRAVSQRAAELAALQADQARKQDALARAHARQQAVLAQLNRRVVRDTDSLKRLRRDEQRLAELVRAVRQTVADLPVVFTPVPPGRFAALKGKLPPPVPVKINAAFGSAKGAQTDVRWKGVLLAARPGQEVRAVYPGRVVYADWLRGFGLLLILEHGEGYMTLYGHGQSLYKKVGEAVEAGEIIALAGNTGGFAEPGLYFELRHQGEPRNPIEWFAR